MLKTSTAALILALAAAPLAAQDTTSEGVIDDTIDTVQEGVDDGVDTVQEGVDEVQDALDPDAMPDTGAQATAGAEIMVTAPEGYVVLSDWSALTAETVTGADLRDASDTGIGSVTDLELGAEGQVTAIIADVGGFLGMGTHTVRLGIEDVAIYHHSDGGLIVYTGLSADALKAMPEYTPPQG